MVGDRKQSVPGHNDYDYYASQLSTQALTLAWQHILFGSNHISGMAFVQALDLLRLWRLFRLVH